MPPMAIAIPVINRAPPPGAGSIDKDKLSKKLARVSRKYPEGPLPIKPSDHAPKNARITGRDLDDMKGVTYQLKIGDVSINDVGIEEILDYVSPLDLEEYENREFMQERVVLTVLEAEKEMERATKLERQKERAKRKGVVIFEQIDSTEGVTEGEDDVQVGKHGRARPTYTHLFKKFGPERSREADPRSGRSMSVSGEEGQGLSGENKPVRLSDLATELPKRRRRKRDKVTGELIPLSPEQTTAAKEKRGRRRRHPVTGELMPLGWRYDSEEDRVAHQQEQDDFSQQSFRKLSISQQPSAKRQRLDVESSVSRSPSRYASKQRIGAQPAPVKAESSLGMKASNQSTLIDLMSSDDEPAPRPSATETPKAASLKPLPMSSTPKRDNGLMIKSRRASSSPETSPEPETKASVLRPSNATTKSPLSTFKHESQLSQQQSQTRKTSIMNPSATRASSTEPTEQPTDEEEEEDSDAEPWYNIEAILGHEESDPATHPPELGDKPVMLYLVKWEGFEELTWEPPESFGDPSVIQSYRARVGLDSTMHEGEGMKDEEEDTIVIPTSSRDSRLPPSMETTQSTMDTQHNNKGYEENHVEEVESDEAEYEVEAILGHHLSDPNTHPAELGRKPVLLYKVKWKGYTQTTWEPASSFEDKEILQKYHERIGRQVISRK